MSQNASTHFGIDPARLAMGVHARHIPLNLIFQSVGGTGHEHAGVFQFRHETDLVARFQGHTHIALIGDAFIRPRLIIGTNALRGEGIASIYRHGFPRLLELQKSGEAEVLFQHP